MRYSSNQDSPPLRAHFTMRPSRTLLLLLAGWALPAGANYLMPLAPAKQRSNKGATTADLRTSHSSELGKLATGAVTMPVTLPIAARVVRTLFRLPRRLMALIPSKLPRWWRSSGLTTNQMAQAAFLGSNVAYLAAGLRLLMRATPNPMGWLMLTCCGISTVYHSMQCTHGCESVQAAKWCYIDTTVKASLAWRSLCRGGEVP